RKFWDTGLRPAPQPPPPLVLPDTIVQLTRLITARIMSRYVHRPVVSVQVDVPCSSGKKSRPPNLQRRNWVMKSKRLRTIAIVAAVVSALSGSAMSAQNKYTVKVPGGLAFSEFRGYEAWQVVSVSQDGPLMAVILANPVMIAAYRAGVPGNGKPFPDGSKMAKIHWNPKKLETFSAATVPGTLHDV